MTTTPARLAGVAAPWIKACGLREAEHGIAAVEAGANLLGCVLAEGSPRTVSLNHALGLAQRWAGLPCAVIAVVVDLVQGDPLLSEWSGPIQVHGSISDEAARTIRDRGIDLILAGPDAMDLSGRAARVGLAPKARLYDHASPGSGTEHDWASAHDAIAPFRSIAIVAGGVDPSNVARVVGLTRGAGVDASSGLERTRGTKDLELLTAYCRAARQAFQEWPSLTG
ncbi:MAG: hypothetical protein O2819_02655 [Planctomycetota bacterium]|nr:hypothetical protein [Planctomycetota bacterium]MDA1105779.1 hypothetical protein [Planctomycetota bacterium]